MRFLVFLENNKISLFDMENGFSPQYIAGLSEFDFEITHAKGILNRLVDELAREYSLEKTKDVSTQELIYKDIQLVFVRGVDEISNSVFEKLLSQYIVDVIKAEQILQPAYEELVNKKDILVKSYGVNYDGENFKLKNGKFERSDFDLLGYTITPPRALKIVSSIL